MGIISYFGLNSYPWSARLARLRASSRDVTKMEQRGRQGAGDRAFLLPGRDRATGIGGAAPAGGVRPLALGRRRPPPAGTMTRREELADRWGPVARLKARPGAGGRTAANKPGHGVPGARPGAA